jgi:tetratricopeptide (TPR) repeat protein
MGNAQKIKQEAVKCLQKDISNLNAGDLEVVAHRVVELLEEKQLIHRGLNKDGKPVGYTLDTFSGDRTVIAEYSTEAGYFEKPYSKIQKDCQHAIKQASAAKKLYLMSNQECDNSQWPKVNEVIAREIGAGVKHEPFDSRRLAEVIYDEVLTKNNLVEYFADFLPTLWDAWTQHVVSNSPPQPPRDFVHDATRAKIVAEAIQQYPRVAIQGISGTGKTYSTIEYAKDHSSDYRNTIWLGDADLAGVTNLAAVRIHRLGVDINLASHLRTSPCLLVVDDFKGHTADLADLLPADIHPGTRVVITCIENPGPEFTRIELPVLSEEAALQVLEYGLPTKPRKDLALEICKHVSFHPLTLAVIRDTVRETEAEWEQILKEISEVVKYEGADQQTILQRVLLNHSSGIAEELCVLRWLDVRATDAAVVREVLGTAGLGKVLRRSILRKDADGMCRMHDLMLLCIRHYNGSSVSDEQVAQRLWGFFQKSWERGSYHFQRALEVHRKFISNRFTSGDRKPSLEAYLFLLLEFSPATNEDLVAFRQHELPALVDNTPACLCVIEAMERSYHSERYLDQKQRILGLGINNITSGLTAVKDDRLRRDFLHHRGKLYYWQRRNDEASDDFEAALKLDPQAYFCDLQLARIKARRNDETSREHVEKILAAFESDEESVPITQVLAAFAELEKRINAPLRSKWLGKKLETFETAISLATVGGFSQPYRTLSGLGRIIYYDRPKVLMRLSDMVSFPPATDAEEWECFDVAECLKSVGKACAEELQDHFAEQKWLERSLEYYERVPNPDCFKLTMMAESLIRLRRFDDAVIALDRCEEKAREKHWWHRRSLALEGLDRVDAAAIAIDNALALLTEKQFASAFLRVKARLQAVINSDACIETINEAIRKVDNQKFRKELEADLAAYRRRFP